MNVLGYKGSAQFFSYDTPHGTYDEVFDSVMTTVFSQLYSLPVKSFISPSDPGTLHEYLGLIS